VGFAVGGAAADADAVVEGLVELAVGAMFGTGVGVPSVTVGSAEEALVAGAKAVGVETADGDWIAQPPTSRATHAPAIIPNPRTSGHPTPRQLRMTVIWRSIPHRVSESH